MDRHGGYDGDTLHFDPASELSPCIICGAPKPDDVRCDCFNATNDERGIPMSHNERIHDVVTLVKQLNEKLEELVALGFEWSAGTSYTTPNKIKLDIKAPIVKENVFIA